MLTFIFFRIAAGDPASAILSKNPSPADVENLRAELSSDKPLFYGYWRQTEAFTSANFANAHDFKGVSLKASSTMGKGFLRINAGKIVFSRNFIPAGFKTLKAQVSYRGAFTCENASFKSEKWQKADIEFSSGQDTFSIIIPETANFADFKYISFYKKQSSAFDSQFFSSLREICTFTEDFPYLSFFNFGKTVITRENIRTVLWRGVFPSLCLMIPVFLGEMFLGIILALVSTAFRGLWPDRLIVVISVAGMSISYLVFIIAGQWFLAYYLDLFPVWGYGNWRYLVLPIMLGILSGLGEGVRFYRTIFVNELNKEYLRTALSKGCSTYVIYGKHLLANAAIPLITRASSILPFLFTGSLLLESFFGIPGLGYAGINAVMNADIQMVKALVVLTALIFVFINLLADIAYAWADPRIRI